MKLLNLSAGYGAYREGNVKTAAALGESCKLESSDRSSILLTSTTILLGELIIQEFTQFLFTFIK